MKPCAYGRLKKIKKIRRAFELKLKLLNGMR